MMHDIICKGRNRIKREVETAKTKLSTEYVLLYQSYEISGKQIIKRSKKIAL